MHVNNKVFYFKLLVISMAIIWFLILGYTLKLHSVIEKNILGSIDELALHDRKAFNANLDFILEELNGIAKRMQLGKEINLHQMYSNLNIESSTTLFANLYLVATNGMVYSDKFVAYQSPPKILSGLMQQHNSIASGGRERFVLDYTEHSEFSAISSRNVIIYGIKLTNTEIAGIQMSMLVGTTDKSFIQHNMIIESFVDNGVVQGINFIIDSSGRYIFGNKKTIYPGKEKNFFAFLEKNATPSIDKNEALEKIRNHETFSFYAEEASTKKLFYLVPFSASNIVAPDWYFVLAINNDVLEEQQSTYSLMGLSLLGLAILLLAGIMFYALRTNHKLYKANEAIKVRSEFLSNMSHEIRTPLNGMIGLNYLINTHLSDKNRMPQIREWLKKSKSLADYLLSLLNDILDMSKLQSGKIDIQSEPYSIEAMLDDIWYMQSANMEKKGINFSISKDINWLWIIGDETRTKQILTNILGNAAKFTPRGGTVTLQVSQKMLDGLHIFTVYRCEDSGIGMSPGFLKTIFDPFSQEQNANSDNTIKGTGLGMPICKELVEAMEGTIVVDSVLGKGSIFTISIPSKIGEPISRNEPNTSSCGMQPEWNGIELPSSSPRSDTDVHGKNKIKILLAEDADFNVEFLVELLEGEGFEVIPALNGKMALEIFENSGIDEFDIILMDMQMPVMDGGTAAAAIRKLDRPDAETVTIYACTANTFKEDVDKALASGMNDFLTKPINIKIFLEKLKKVKSSPQLPSILSLDNDTRN